MNWFHRSSTQFPFEMLSTHHIFVIGILITGAFILYFFRNFLKDVTTDRHEFIIALTLIIFEVGYQVWLFQIGMWQSSHALPLELCNISLFLIILLLLTKHRTTFEIVFFIGIAGALQAIFTPVLNFGFPHFRFVHFFYTHIFIIWVCLYFVWVKGYRPTIFSVIKAMLFLNILLPLILFINKYVEGNYWFLTEKPRGVSLLDWLGPHPWYILSLQFVAITLFLILWLLFREKSKR
ncbi:TIGR02206 family membrane protein [Bacillus shivajii]|uniref:YwaF family protein n=1 Tax=Bacillus shivajii TaxID=1983719 RepID=UPI001CFA817A|nr:TIGR02206 family membrane protein [Bacillus shivajii]UCZ55172.1 TIGR02206 family membrane protein [Bacillus shivajii]